MDKPSITAFCMNKLSSLPVGSYAWELWRLLLTSIERVQEDLKQEWGRVYLGYLLQKRLNHPLYQEHREEIDVALDQLQIFLSAI